LEGSGLYVILRYYPGIRVGAEENHKKKLKIAYLRAEILTQDLPNTKQEC
jgi:hypothetical protein